MQKITRLELHPWCAKSLPEIVLTEISEVFQVKLTFLAANIEDETVKVICNSSPDVIDYWGGELIINCGGVVVFDKGKLMITIHKKCCPLT